MKELLYESTLYKKIAICVQLQTEETRATWKKGETPCLTLTAPTLLLSHVLAHPNVALEQQKIQVMEIAVETLLY